MNITELVSDSRKGNISSFMELILQKQKLIYKIAWTYIENPSDMEDCIADTTIKAFDKLYQLKDENKFYAWYLSILINKCRSYSKRYKNEVPIETATSFLADYNSFNDTDNRILLESILSSLQGRSKDVLVLKYLKGLTLKEIAYIMKIPQNTVKSLLYRALDKLKRKTAKKALKEV